MKPVLVFVVLCFLAKILAQQDIGIYCTTANLNLRAQPSSAKGVRVIRVLPKGTAVNVLRITDGWGALIEGFVSMAYLANCSSPAVTPEIMTDDQIFYSTRARLPHERCEGTNSTTCYTKLYVPSIMNMILTDYDTRFHIADVYTFKELCNQTSVLIKKFETISDKPFTCINYHNNSALIENILSPQISYKPVTFLGWQSVYIETWWAPHFDIRNYCYYCQHDTREEFRQLVQDYKLPYFWKHSREAGDDGSNAVENPTILAKVHLQYIKWFKSQPGRAGMYTGRRAQNNLTDFLYLTQQRNRFKDEIGEDKRGEYHYNVYCSAWNMWGTYCDSFVWFWNPLRFSVWPIADYIIRIILLIAIITMLWIPRIQYHIKTHITSIRKIPRFVYEFFADIKIHTMFFMTIGIAFIIVEDSADFKTTQGEFHSWRGVFRVVSGASTATGFLSLLVLWSHVYYSSMQLSIDASMNLGNKLTLIIFYLSVTIMCVIAAILYGVIADYRAWIFVSIMCFAVIFFSILVVGFLVYGTRMYCILRAVNSEVNFVKLKFTKFMIVIMVLFMNYISWMLIMAIETALPGHLTVFFALMKNPVMDLSSIILYPFVIYILFDRQLFYEFKPFGLVRDGIETAFRNIKRKIAEKIEERKVSLKDFERDDEEELKAGLMNTFSSDSDNEPTSKYRIQI